MVPPKKGWSLTNVRSNWPFIKRATRTNPGPPSLSGQFSLSHKKCQGINLMSKQSGLFGVTGLSQERAGSSQSKMKDMRLAAQISHIGTRAAIYFPDTGSATTN